MKQKAANILIENKTKIVITKEYRESKFEYIGKTENFGFVIPHSNLYEPLLVTINDNRGLFLTNLYFDKHGLFKYFKFGSNNDNLYQEATLARLYYY